MKLNRSLTTTGLLFTSVSAMVGSGWLFGGLYAAKLAGPAAILAWVIGSVLLLFIGITFAEIATALPLTGGIARFTQFTHGSVVSMCMSWLAWLSCVAVPATEAQAILQYSANYYPGLVHSVNNTPVLTTIGFLAATVILLIFTIINVLAVKWMAKINNKITWWKLTIPLLTGTVLISQQFHVRNFGLSSMKTFMPYGMQGVLWSLPAAGIVFSFLGFRECISMAGEAANPKRAIPVALISSIAICTLLYVVVQVAFIGALSPTAIKNGWSALNFGGDAGPFAGIAITLGLHWLALLIYTDAVVSPSGTGLVYTMTTARLNYGMSVNRYIPHFMMGVNGQGAPVFAVLFNFIVGLFMLIPFSTWQKLVAFQSTAIVISYGMGPICLLALRSQMPKLNRPFYLPWAKLLCPISFYVCNLITFWTGWDTIRQLGMSVLLGAILLGLYRFKAKRAQEVPLSFAHAWWLIIYLAGITLLSYLGSFGGGKNIMTFGWDFIVIALFSLCIFTLALKVKMPKKSTRALIAHDEEMEDFYQKAGIERMIGAD